MKGVDKSIRLIASGSSNYGGDWIKWNQTVLEYLKDQVDYISLHNYTGNRSNSYYEFMASTGFAEKAIKITEGIIQAELSKNNRKKPVYIAFDEYNVWYRAKGEEGNEEIYNLEDALVVATYLNIFIRNANSVKMANMAQLVNVIAPIFTTNQGSWYQTIFYPLSLFANNCYGKALETYTDCPAYQLNGKDIPYLDVSSACNKERNEVILNVVNRHKDHPVVTDIISQYGSFSGNASIYEVNGKDIKDQNSAKEQLVKTKKMMLNVKGEKFSYSFPAHSYTMIIIPLGTN
jgi:alpha-N-arabinofuranosidase